MLLESGIPHATTAVNAAVRPKTVAFLKKALR
jgi:hypothetical protein